MLVNFFFCLEAEASFLSGKGSVGGVKADKKAKTTPDAGGKSVIE
jgi:hypothetical protein